jgi:phage gp46-like protein
MSMRDLSASLFTNENWPENEELTEENYLLNSISISLFSDARADQLPAREESLRGYWADSFDKNKKPLGSLMWLIAHHPSSRDTLDEAIKYAHRACSGLISEKEISDLRVEGEWREGKLVLQLTIEKENEFLKYQFDVRGGASWI